MFVRLVSGGEQIPPTVDNHHEQQGELAADLVPQRQQPHRSVVRRGHAQDAPGHHSGHLQHCHRGRVIVREVRGDLVVAPLIRAWSLHTV